MPRPQSDLQNQGRTGTARKDDLATAAASEPTQSDASLAAQEAPGGRAAVDSQVPLREAFAKQVGYSSFLEFFEASSPVSTPSGDKWFITADPRGGCVAWKQGEFDQVRRFASREQAEHFVKSQ